MVKSVVFAVTAVFLGIGTSCFGDIFLYDGAEYQFGTVDGSLYLDIDYHGWNVVYNDPGTHLDMIGGAISGSLVMYGNSTAVLSGGRIQRALSVNDNSKAYLIGTDFSLVTLSGTEISLHDGDSLRSYADVLDRYRYDGPDDDNWYYQGFLRGTLASGQNLVFTDRFYIWGPSHNTDGPVFGDLPVTDNLYADIVIGAPSVVPLPSSLILCVLGLELSRRRLRTHNA